MDRVKEIHRARIEQLAKEAAASGATREDSCPYPFDSPEGQHFTATYLVSLPRGLAAPRRFGIPRENTTCPELTDRNHRAGSSAARGIPSRMGNRLVYRDGTVTDLNGKLLGAPVR